MIPPSLSAKIVVGGDGGVGKTAVLYRYINNAFSADTQMTIGVQMHARVVERSDVTIKILFWDLSGQERFRFILPQYCAGASGAFVLFDMNDDETFDSIDRWHDMLSGCMPVLVPFILVGTKLD